MVRYKSVKKCYLWTQNPPPSRVCEFDSRSEHHTISKGYSTPAAAFFWEPELSGASAALGSEKREHLVISTLQYALLRNLASLCQYGEGRSLNIGSFWWRGSGHRR